MNRKKHGNYRHILLVLGLWFFWFQNVSASQMLFPFVADDWISFEGRTFLQLQQEKKQTEIKKQRNHKKSNEKSNHHVCPRYGHRNCQRAGECNR